MSVVVEKWGREKRLLCRLYPFVSVAGAVCLSWLFVGCGQENEEEHSERMNRDAGSVDDSSLECQSKSNDIMDPGEELGADYVFDDKRIHTFTIDIESKDWVNIQAYPFQEKYVPACVSYEGFEFSHAAIRFKGGLGNLNSCMSADRDCQKLPMKIKFSEYDDKRRFFGLKRINLHAMERDRSRLREMIAYRLFRDFEVPASRTAYANLVINGEPRGLHLAVEQVDGQFTRARFSDGGKGNLYKEIWFTETGWRGGLRTNRDDNPDVSAMSRMSQEFRSTDQEDFRDKINKWVEVSTLTRYLAVEESIGHFDGISAWYTLLGNHNFYIYEYTDAERVVLIAWDLDISLYLYDVANVLVDMYGVPAWNDLDVDCDRSYPVFNGLSARAPTCDPFMKGLALTMWTDYVEATHRFLDTLFTEERIVDQIDTYAQLIEEAIAEDERGPDLEEWRQEVERLKGRIGDLRQRALETVSANTEDGE